MNPAVLRDRYFPPLSFGEGSGVRPHTPAPQSCQIEISRHSWTPPHSLRSNPQKPPHWMARWKPKKDFWFVIFDFDLISNLFCLFIDLLLFHYQNLFTLLIYFIIYSITFFILFFSLCCSEYWLLAVLNNSITQKTNAISIQEV